ncbi:uncharacterized protein LOC108927782 isoform X2 [Scleropages formosus]|uniref:uncharacterized protein LOC108927782 isoform X2 n=1 Tax=Scleropages formosus TaxID=113540 RepID=UPI000877FB28|nr:uncharacterized protein LOC108927782 isoform X2 [Scleropages formosus]
MLRRSFSCPLGANWHRPRESPARAMHDLGQNAWHAKLPERGQQQCVWERRERGSGWEELVEGDPLLKFHGKHENSFEHEEGKVSDSQQDYTREEEYILNFPDLNRLKKMNEDLQKSLDIAEDFNTCLRSENMELKNQVRSMKQSMQEAEQLTDELEVMRSCLEERAAVITKLEAYVKLLEKETKALREQHELFSSEICSILPEREMDKKKIFGLISHLHSLQQQMDETTLALEQKDELIQKKDVLIEHLESSLAEHSSITKDLKEKIKDLEYQLTEAQIHSSGGGFQFFDGTFSPPVTCCVSLAEELQLWPPLRDHQGDIFTKECTEDTEKMLRAHILPSSPTGRLISWQVWCCERMKTVVWATGVICLCFLVLLTLLWTLIPIPCSTKGLTCADVVYCLVQSYRSVYHFGLKPF